MKKIRIMGNRLDSNNNPKCRIEIVESIKDKRPGFNSERALSKVDLSAYEGT